MNKQSLNLGYRMDKKGNGTFTKVMHGWELLKKHDVEVNILCTVHAVNETRPLDVYRFFRDNLGACFLQFIPIVEVADRKNCLCNCVTDRSVNSERFGQFHVEIFKEWVQGDIGRIFVRAFDVALGNYTGQHSLCTHSPTCGRSLILEHNGDIYSCDHFVDSEHLLGNIKNTHMSDLVASRQQLKFGKDKLDMLPRHCKKCDVFFLCYGGCPKDRIIVTPDDEPCLNYLCSGYKAFFQYTIPYLKELSRFL